MAERKFTVSELALMADAFNHMPWTFPSTSQREWLVGFIDTLRKYPSTLEPPKDRPKEV